MTLQFYGATAASSGNGAALSTFIKTIDKYTFSQDRKNNATLGKVDNSGTIEGSANIQSGSGVTHTNTYSNAAGNGVSVNAETDKFAKSSTRATIGNVDNSGKIIGNLNQVSGDNSGFKSIHVASTGNSIASGNGISSFAEIHNAQTKQALATVGDITNTGKITGSALVKSGNGSGDLNIRVKGSGNGMSSYLIADSISKREPTTKAGIGAIANDGMITGHLETHAGITTGSAKNGDENSIPKEEVRLVITTSDVIDMGDGNDSLVLGGKNPDKAPIKVDFDVKNLEKVEVNQPAKMYADADLSSVEQLVVNDKLIYQVNPNDKHALNSANRNKDVNLSGEGTIVLDTYKAFDEVKLSNGKKFVDNDGKVKYDASSIMQETELKDGKIVIKAKLVCKEGTHEVNGKCVKDATPEPLVCEKEQKLIKGVCTTLSTRIKVKTPYIDAYNSAISSWKNTDTNPLQNSASIKDKSKELANKAINDYLDKVVNENIYAELTSVGLDSLHNYRTTTLKIADKMLRQGEVYTTAVISGNSSEYKTGVKSASSTTFMLGASYGIKDDLTAGISIGSGKEHVSGYQSSELKGTSMYISPYIEKGFDENRLLWTSGISYEKINLDGERHISNGYDTYSFDIDVNSSMFSIYSQLSYEKDLTENVKWIPQTAVAYNVFDMGNIREKGIGGLSLDTKKQHATDLNIGQTIQFSKNVGNGILSTGLEMDYTHTFGKDNMTAYFNGSNNVFDLSRDNTNGKFGIGANIGYYSNGFDIKAGLKNSFRNSNNILNATIKVDYKY